MGDGAVYARSGGPGTMSVAAASRADDAASWVRGCDDDEASSVCDYGRDPSRAHGAARACYTRCSADYCETPTRCRPGPGRSLTGTYYSSGGAPDRHMTCSHLVSEKSVSHSEIKGGEERVIIEENACQIFI